MTDPKSKANAVSALFLAILNAIAAFVGLPIWATPEVVGMANSAALSIAALVIYLLDRKPTEPTDGNG